MKLPLAHEISARAMARALLRVAVQSWIHCAGVRCTQSECDAGEGTMRAWA